MQSEDVISNCEVIHFCQAAADVKYILDYYEKNVNEKLFVVVVNVRMVYDFFCSLRLDRMRLLFVPYSDKFSIKNIAIVVAEKKRLMKVYRENFVSIKKSKVYFYCNYFDWITFFFVNKLIEENKVFFLGHYLGWDEFKKSAVGVKEGIKLFLYYVLTGIKFDLTTYASDNTVLRYAPSGGRITIADAKMPKENIFKKYSFSAIESRCPQKAVLVVDAQDNPWISGFREKMISLLIYLKENGYKLYIKPHPRLGYSVEFLEYADLSDINIPSEFLDLSAFVAVIGLSSTVLIDAAKKEGNAYSLMNLFKYTDRSRYDYAKRYIQKQGDGFVKIIDDENEFRRVFDKCE